VRAELRDTTSGKTRGIAADYLVGTDGGASTVRETLGIGMSGTPALTYTTNVIFRCKNFAALHDKGLGYRFIFIGPEGVWLNHRPRLTAPTLPHVDRRHPAEDQPLRR